MPEYQSSALTYYFVFYLTLCVIRFSSTWIETNIVLPVLFMSNTMRLNQIVRNILNVFLLWKITSIRFQESRQQLQLEVNRDCIANFACSLWIIRIRCKRQYDFFQQHVFSWWMMISISAFWIYSWQRVKWFLA